jgi:hypothetical protein
MPGTLNSERAAFESSIRALEAEVASLAAHLSLDANARQLYARQIKAMAEELRNQVGSGKINWKQAAEQAHEARNVIMEVVRSRSTPVERAMAERLKREGKTLNELIAKKTLQLFGEKANFHRLTPAQQNQVYSEIVKAAGSSNPRVTNTMRRMAKAGRALIFISISLSVYTIVTAEDMEAAAIKEVTVSAAGIGGGIAGGAVAGLACGPGAPVCVTIGAFVGGALAAFGVDFFW